MSNPPIPTATVYSAVRDGIDLVGVIVRVRLERKLPAVVIVGLSEHRARETAERVRSAIEASGFEVPRMRVVVEVYRGELGDAGAQGLPPGAPTAELDLPIALGILQASGQMPDGDTHRWVGEFTLEGDVRPVSHPVIFDGLRTADSLRDAVETFGREVSEADRLPDAAPAVLSTIVDTDRAVAAMRVALAFARGVKAVVLVGPQHSGRAHIARHVARGIVRRSAERLRIFDAAGLAYSRDGFRAPHCTVSSRGLSGWRGRPGELSLTHGGVLYLDEAVEFSRKSWEQIRHALRTGRAVNDTGELPAGFHLIAAVESYDEAKRVMGMLDGIEVEVVELPGVSL